MTDNSLVDVVSAGTLLILTGTDVGVDAMTSGFNFLDLISKFGVIAVIWFWLQETKKQLVKQESLFDKKLTELTQIFEKENKEIREQYKEMTSVIKEQYKEHGDRMEVLLREKSEELKQLQNKLYDISNDLDATKK